MNIRITETDTGWNLWATATEDPAAAPIYAAWGRTPAQIEALTRSIMAEVTPPEPVPTATVLVPAANVPLAEGHELTSSGRAVASLALYHVLSALDGWIEGAQSNHRAMEHRNENTGEECWRQIEPADVRTMVNDVARELGVGEFPTPEVAREDMP